jgi:hypothetical protein
LLLLPPLTTSSLPAFSQNMHTVWHDSPLLKETWKNFKISAQIIHTPYWLTALSVPELHPLWQLRAL